MRTLLFVHGTGVRGPAFDATFEAIRDSADRHLGSIDVQPCLWGDELGAKLTLGGASIPTFDVQRLGAPAESDRHERESLRWSLLYADPLYELRTLAALAGDDGFGDEASPFDRRSTTLPQRLLDMTLSGELRQRLERARHPVGELQPAAVTRLRSDAVFAPAIDSAALADPAVARGCVARAFVAAWCAAAADRSRPVLSGETRGRLYEEAVGGLGGATMGLKDLFIDCLGGLASHAATPLLRHYRTEVTQGVTPAAADILLYQARGQRIRDYIEQRVLACETPVLVVAHSLGGIASFELLASRHLPAVTGLVTVGSQAPYLYELDALASLRVGEPLPATFPRWLNVYDNSDMLSYIGAGVFPGRVADVRVDNGEPFPQSHSAYWTNDAVWRAVKEFVA